MNVSSSTQKYHVERINKVVQFINNHLGENLDLQTLASVGNYSTYHFHRIMRAHFGESLGAYIVRLRLETAVSLLRFSEVSISDIAFKVGYESPSSFNKAFKKRFGVSPNEYRQNNSSLVRKESSKILFRAMESLKNLTPKIKQVKTTKVIYSQMLGDYHKSASKAWEVVCDFAKKRRLFGFKTEFIGISHDDPKVTESEKLRYDACIVVTKDIEPEGEIGFKEIPGGKYAVFTHKGAYENFSDTYDYIFGKWIPENNIELRDVQSFEKYLNSPDKTKPEKLLTEIYVPIH